MTSLGCTVTGCLHNLDDCCCKQTIIVDGASANAAHDTFCGSFDENKGGTFTNLFKVPESRLEVDCEAMQCVYNDNRHCSAEHIDIAGDGANQATHTECATFQAR